MGGFGIGRKISHSLTVEGKNDFGKGRGLGDKF